MSARTVPLTPATIVAATRPRSFAAAGVWQVGSGAQHRRALVSDTAERLQGAAYALHGIAVNMEATRKEAVYFVAAALLDQAHVLNAAAAAQLAEERAEDAAPERKNRRRAR